MQLVDILIYFPCQREKHAGMSAPYVELPMTRAGVVVLCSMSLYGASNYPKLFAAATNQVLENVLSSDWDVEKGWGGGGLGLCEFDLSKSYYTALLPSSAILI